MQVCCGSYYFSEGYQGILEDTNFSEGFKVCLELLLLVKDSSHAWSYYLSEGFKACLELLP